MARPAGCDCIVGFSNDALGESRFRFPSQEIDAAVRGDSNEQAHDFTILNLPDLLVRRPYQFEFDVCEPLVGQPVAFLGYPFELNNLCHAGIVSSVHTSGVATLIQIDASVNPSNSGGPLFNVETGAVLGVASRKTTGLSRMFDELVTSFDRSMAVLEGAHNMVRVGGVDFGGALLASQRQMRAISVELKRSANVGIGWAIKADALGREEALNP